MQTNHGLIAVEEAKRKASNTILVRDPGQALDSGNDLGEIDHEVEEEFKRLTQTTPILKKVSVQPQGTTDQRLEEANANMRHHSQAFMAFGGEEDAMMLMSDGTKDIDQSSRNPSILPRQFGNVTQVTQAEKRYGSTHSPIMSVTQQHLLSEQVEDYTQLNSGTNPTLKPVNVGIIQS